MSQRMPETDMKIVLQCRGSLWWVTVRHNDDDGRLWMEDGWPIFANAMRLQYLDIVSFRYSGDGKFVTNVFDVSSIRSPFNELSLIHDGQNLEACACESEFFDAVKVTGAGTNGGRYAVKFNVYYVVQFANLLTILTH